MASAPGWAINPQCVWTYYLFRRIYSSGDEMFIKDSPGNRLRVQQNMMCQNSMHHPLLGALLLHTICINCTEELNYTVYMYVLCEHTENDKLMVPAHLLVMY